MEAYWLTAKKGKIGEIYNIGGIEPIKIELFLKQLISYSNKEIKTYLDPKLLRKNDITLQIPDITKFKKHTGWKNTTKLKKSSLDLLQYFRDKYNV